jgi:hypothetical protein
MEDWDQETLEKVVESKRTEYQQNKPTDIVWPTTPSLLYNQLIVFFFSQMFCFCHFNLVSS